MASGAGSALDGLCGSVDLCVGLKILTALRAGRPRARVRARNALIEELQRSKAALEVREHELDMANLSKDTFFSIIAHDLRDPIGGLLNASELLAKRFDKLFRIDVHPSRPGTASEPGNGPGLIICKELVALNRGGISATSEPDKGSIFTVRLPSDLQQAEVSGAPPGSGWPSRARRESAAPKAAALTNAAAGTES